MRTTRLLKAILDDRSGGTAIEYGLIAALIVIAMIAAFDSVANETMIMWSNVEGSMEDANSRSGG